jgi:hypothetical protein
MNTDFQYRGDYYVNGTKMLWGKMNMLEVLCKNNKRKCLRLHGTAKGEFSGPFRILDDEELEVI